MHSGLLNVWRENGAYLRYADAKALFVLGISIASLFSFLKHSLISDNSDWSLIKQLWISDLSCWSLVSILFFVLAAGVAASAVIPVISEGMNAVNFFNQLGFYFHTETSPEDDRDFIYFKSIAAAKNSDAYFQKLMSVGVFKDDVEEADRQLVTQIWVISRITFSKFVAVKISIFAFSIAVLCGLLGA